MKRCNVLVAILLGTMLLVGCNNAPSTPAQKPVDTEMTESQEPETEQVNSETENSQVPETESESQEPETTSRRDNIKFADGQLYAVAYLGFQEMKDVDYYEENYLDEGSAPIHNVSGGDYYLIIPRYDDMEICLYKNDMETNAKDVVFQDKSGKPFIVQCNISDIFADATIEFTYNGEKVEFSPYISLEDGSVKVGEKGLDITKK